MYYISINVMLKKSVLMSFQVHFRFTQGKKNSHLDYVFVQWEIKNSLA